VANRPTVAAGFIDDVEIDDDDLVDEQDESRARPVRTNVPSWHDAVADIIARNMASRSKSGGGGRRSGGRGRGDRRPGPRHS
jgi:hypothetical protein